MKRISFITLIEYDRVWAELAFDKTEVILGLQLVTMPVANGYMGTN